MICRECHHNKPIHCFHEYTPGRARKICKACRSSLEKQRVTDARREEFRRVTSWPVPQ